MSKLIYCATPSRIKNRKEEIMDFVTNQGYAPLHPFQAYPYDRFEGNPRIGREKSMEFCLRLVDICDEFWMFGVSEGTLIEVVYAIENGKTVRLKFESFDAEWRKFYEELGEKYSNPIDYLIVEQDL